MLNTSTIGTLMPSAGRPPHHKSGSVIDVRFTPDATKLLRSSEMTRCAMCGRLRVGKGKLHVALLVGAAMCSACWCGSHDRWPIMPSADQVPTKSSHSIMLWHKWVVLIAGSTGSALRAVRPPNFTSCRLSGAISLRRKRDRFFISAPWRRSEITAAACRG